MMPSIALNPDFRTGVRSGTTRRSGVATLPRSGALTASSVSETGTGAIVDLDDPRDGARNVILALVAAALVAFVLASLLFASALKASMQDVDALAPARSTEQTAPVFPSSGSTVSIPTGPAVFVMLAQGQD